MKTIDKIAQNVMGAAIGASLFMGAVEGVALLINKESPAIKPAMITTVTDTIHDNKLWEEYKVECEDHTYSSYNDRNNTVCKDIEAKKRNRSENWTCVAEIRNSSQTGNYWARKEFVNSQ